jgi:hypothetical protein
LIYQLSYQIACGRPQAIASAAIFVCVPLFTLAPTPLLATLAYCGVGLALGRGVTSLQPLFFSTSISLLKFQ